MNITKLLGGGLIAIASFSSHVSFAASSVPHDSLEPISGLTNTLTQRYLPLLNIGDGCHPYTAVDADGNWNAGLKDSGSNGGNCSLDTKQQVYVRGAAITDKITAIMYAYYFPKDNGYLVASIGHRHDWEYVMVFVENYNDTYNSSNEKIIGAVYSAHGGLSASTNPNRGGNNNTHIYINYDFHGSVTHSFAEGSKGSVDKHRAIIWGLMTDAARNSLNVRDFGNAVVPVRNRDNKFQNEVEKAKDALGL